MQKNPQENFSSIEIDPVTGEHYVIIPEWILDEKGWYEGIELNIEVENDCIVIRDIDWFLDIVYIMQYDSKVTHFYYG